MAGDNRMRDPYTVLGVSRSADMVEIKAAWRAMAKKLHPDQNRGDPSAQSRFTEVGRAYDLLKDPEKRRRYDEMLNRTSFASANAGRQSAAAGNSRRPGEEPTFMERRAEKARMEAEARARAEAEARMREEAEARARMKAQAERARAEAEQAGAAGPDIDIEDDDVTPEQHEQFFEKLFGSRRQAGSNTEGPNPGRRSEDKPPREEAPRAAEDKPRAEAPAAEPKAAEPDSGRPQADAETTAQAAYRADADAASDEGNASPARNLFSYLVKRLTGQVGAPDRAPEHRVDAWVTIEDLLSRVNPTVNAPDGKLLTVPLPDDAMEGTTVRLEGYGHKLPGMKRGDVVATLRIKPHRWYRPEHYDLHTFHDIDIENAVLGCETTVETPDGPVRIRVPEWSGSNRVVKVEGHGLPRGGGRRGNLVVEIRVMLWDHPDQKVIDLMRSLREGLFL
jgi:DnaJ-class molecular chaperone